jgi:hypothetical protein
MCPGASMLPDSRHKYDLQAKDSMLGGLTSTMFGS